MFEQAISPKSSGSLNVRERSEQFENTLNLCKHLDLNEDTDHLIKLSASDQGSIILKLSKHFNMKLPQFYVVCFNWMQVCVRLIEDQVFIFPNAPVVQLFIMQLSRDYY